MVAMMEERGISGMVRVPLIENHACMHVMNEGMHAWDEGVCWLGPSIPWNHSDKNAYLLVERE